MRVHIHWYIDHESSNLNCNLRITLESVLAFRRGTVRMKELPIQGSRALAKLFQEAWKKGAEAEQVNLSTSVFK